MNKEKVRKEIIALRKSANVAYVGSVNGEGFPQIKGMLVLESESMKVQYFSTNTGSRRVAQFRANPKACVYYVDDTKNKYKGALFTGTIEKSVLTTKQRQCSGATDLKCTTRKAWMIQATASTASPHKA